MKTLSVLLLLIVTLRLEALPLHAGGCSSSVAAAVEHSLKTASMADGSFEKGFRVQAVYMDRVRGHAYAMVQDCEHPSHPLIAVLLPDGSLPQVQKTKQLLVHTGDSVEMISAGGVSRVYLHGHVESSAAVGEVVEVRLDGSLLGATEPAALLHGRVLAANLVEIVR